MLSKKCKVCKITFYRRPKENSSDWKARKFCSLKCAYIGRKSTKGRKCSEETKNKMSKSKLGNKFWLGKKHTKETRKKMSLARKGKKPRLGKTHTKETKLLISKHRKNKCLGKNNPRYIDGRSFLPYTTEFNQDLKDKIRKRDNYTCQNCSMTEEEHLIIFGTNLHIHHIDYIKENCNEINLMTLCRQCNLRANFNRGYWKKYFYNLLIKRVKICLV